jgi:hypothetical protein
MKVHRVSARKLMAATQQPILCMPDGRGGRGQLSFGVAMRRMPRGSVSGLPRRGAAPGNRPLPGVRAGNGDPSSPELLISYGHWSVPGLITGTLAYPTADCRPRCGRDGYRRPRSAINGCPEHSLPTTLPRSSSSLVFSLCVPHFGVPPPKML